MEVQMSLMSFAIFFFAIGGVLGYILGHRFAFLQFKEFLGSIKNIKFSLEVDAKKMEKKVQPLVVRIFNFFKKIFNFLNSVKISIKRVPKVTITPPVKK